MSSPVVLITGALTGIGRAAAVIFAQEGANVVVSGRRDKEGKDLVAELQALGAEAIFVRTDVRKDEECTDTVGVFLRVGEEDKSVFRVSLGPQVQTLTRAMTSILCRGLENATVNEVLDVPSDFVPKIVGGELVRARSQTVYYVLTRMKGISKVFLNRRRAANLS